MILNDWRSIWTWKVGRIFGLRSIGLVSLVLKEGLTDLFILVDVTTVRIKLTIMWGVTVSLNVVGISGHAWIYRCRLTRRSVRVYLFFIKHLHFLSIVPAVALWRRSCVLPILLKLPILLVTQIIRILHASWIIPLPLINLVILLHVINFSSFCKLRNARCILVFLIRAVSLAFLLPLLFGRRQGHWWEVNTSTTTIFLLLSWKLLLSIGHNVPSYSSTWYIGLNLVTVDLLISLGCVCVCAWPCYGTTVSSHHGCDVNGPIHSISITLTPW